MKTIKTGLTVISVLAMAGSALAQDNKTYVNIGVDTLEFDQFGIGGKVGYQFSDFFGVEAQGSLGVIDDDVESNGVSVDLGYDFLVGAFATGTVPLSERVNLIGGAGYYFTEINAKTASGTTSLSEDIDGVAFGAGLQYMWDAKNGVRADYTYLDGNGGHADSVSVSYVYKF